MKNASGAAEKSRRPGFMGEKLRSARGRIMVIFCLGLLIIGMVMLGNNYFAIQKMQNQIKEYNTRILSLYMGQIDHNLEEFDNFMYSVLANNSDLELFNREKNTLNESEQILAARRFTLDMVGMVQRYSWLHSLCIIRPGKIPAEIMVKGVATVQFHEALYDYIESLDENIDALHWKVVNLNGEYYAIHTVPTGDSYMCAITSISRLMVQTQYLDAEFSKNIFLISDNNRILSSSTSELPDSIEINAAKPDFYTTGDDGRYSVVKKGSERANIQLLAVYDNQKIKRMIMDFTHILFYVVAGAVVIGVAAYISMKKNILVPLKELQDVANNILSGNLDSRVKDGDACEEFSLTNRSINKMLDRIQTLRVNVYEEQLDNQQLEIEKLQQQIRPHFLLNAFNLIYNMAQSHDYELIKEMSLNLSNYFRYRVNSSRDLVPLLEEIQCVENYLNIQKIRYPDNFDFRIDLAADATHALVVPLMIQTFAENAIKHAFSDEEAFFVTIRVRRIQYVLEKAVCIEICDNGPGYPSEILTLFESEDVRKVGVIGVGITNVKRRLQLIFGSRAQIILENDPETNGARATVTMPYIVRDDCVRRKQ